MRYLLILLLFATAACEATDDTVSALTDEDLLFLYEEEKVARDIYDHFESIYGLMPFVNISQSEQSHFETMEALVLRLGILDEDEVFRTEPGIFIIDELQAIYDELKAAGDVSEIEALKVGAYIEEHDITDLMAAIEKTGSEDVRSTLGTLVEASKNHLRAFNRNLANRGVVYEPVLLEADFFNEIINSRTACCQSGGKGNRRGAGNKSGSCCSK